MAQVPKFATDTLVAQRGFARVVNYAQSRSADNFHAMLDDPAAQVRMPRATALADQVDPHLHTVESIHHR